MCGVSVARWQGKTTERGYGSRHQSERNHRLDAWKPGDLCAHCGQPMWWKWATLPNGRRISMLDLPHNDDRTGYLSGLAHRGCNRSDGARRGNRKRGSAKRWASARRW